MSSESFTYSQRRHPILSELEKYKQKYYTNLLVKGVLVSFALLLSAYIIFNFLEFWGNLESWFRAILFYGFMALAGFSLLFWVIIPVSKLFKIGKIISDEEAALQIGHYFPNIDDKLLNTIQLQRQNDRRNALLLASIEQRSQELAIVRFTDAIQLSENRKYLKYVIPPLLLLLLVFLISPQFFTESSKRIIYYNKKTPAPAAPFTFHLENKSLKAFKNEDFTVTLKMKSSQNMMPEGVYLMSEGRKFKMKKEGVDEFSYTFKKIQAPLDFYFEASGFNSSDFQVELIERPALLSFDAYLSYPAYLGKKDDSWNNVGNLVVPEGTQIRWEFNTNEAEELRLIFGGQKPILAKKQGASFQYSRVVRKSENYQVKLKNQYSENKNAIEYSINVIPDQFPKITMKEYQDEEMFAFLMVGGNISDDYGISALKLFYRIDREVQTGAFRAINIPLNKEQTIQNFYYELDLQKLQLKPGDKLFYYAQVWDNDGVNGSKSAKTTTKEFKIPTREEMIDEIDKSAEKTEEQINRTLQKAQKLQDQLDNLRTKLLNKRSLEYQDKKQIEELLKQREEIQKEIEEIKENNKMTNEKQERFSERSEEIKEKMEQLENIMEELLDEETQKMYEELQKMLEEQRNNDQLLQQMEKINTKEENLEQELERTLEMFKQLQFEQKLEQTTESLQELAEEQEELAEQNENKELSNEELKEKQEEIQEKFEELQKELDELKEMDEELKTPNGMPEEMPQEQEISEQMQESIEKLEENKSKKAQEPQKKAGEKMQEMAKQMEQMNESMQMEQMQESIDDLRAILENLITLSFEQEALMKEFKNVSFSDPRFKELAQQQLKLQDDAKIIEDSLMALAQRVFEIESFVTREVTQMKNYMVESTQYLKERKVNIATGKQQFAMTSMNNLALLLDDVLQQMQDAMQNASGMPQDGNQSKPSMSQLQQQINQQIEELKKSGKTGKPLSQELAKLARKQEQLRKMLQQMEKDARNNGEGELGDELKQIQEEMEETEEDLVNKQISEELLERQKEIETRLLDSEKAMRERGEEEKRESKTAQPKPKTIPPDLKEYFENKEKQIELLKTIPPALSPYYKREVDEYFEKIDK